jgi:hypothetical protein
VIRLAGGRKVQVSSHDEPLSLICEYFTPQHVLLVGGFGESPYLRARLRAGLQSYIPDIITADEPSYVLVPLILASLTVLFTLWIVDGTRSKKAAA